MVDAVLEPEIKILDEKLINQIAAGEVIERPASVVKELIENSIDAKATKIEIIILDGGLKEITVIDNGHGMSKKNAQLAFESHSTSKIRSFDDLMMVRTFGFRGEALASIAVVSNIELKTRTKNSTTGTLITINGGKILKISEIGCPEGTSISVKNLFYNVPVRKKYLKSLNTELGHIIETVSLIAFANPAISFKLTHNGREILNLPGTGKLLDNIARRYGVDVAKNMLKIDFQNDWIKITGYTSNLQEIRASKYYITIIVNNRVIKNPIIMNAILDAYRTLLMRNKYPITILNIIIDPKLVDVNIHPTKKEVRFINEDDIYDVVQIAVKNVLDNIKQVREIKLEPVNKLELSEFKKNIRHTDKNTIPTLKHQKKQKLLVDNVKITGNYKQKPDLISKPDKTKKLPPMEYIGQLFKTYLLFSDEENFYLIDQHAAHERIRLEQLLKANSSKPIRTQKLISPIKIDLLPGELIDIKKIIPLLSDYGFEISHFGGTTFIVKGIPIIFKKILTMDEIKDLLDELIHIKGKLSLKDLRNKIVNLLSCKGAIKANTVLSDERAINLVKELSFCQNPFSCCHGRPTIISFSKNEIEKKFKRT
ncbi:MAG: DNA mismatch repair endonuclease MutL [Candidatus Helarchaeota archaeon]